MPDQSSSMPKMPDQSSSTPKMPDQNASSPNNPNSKMPSSSQTQPVGGGKNPVDILIDIERNNQQLLTQIAQDQAIIKKIAEKQYHSEQRKFWLGIIKYSLYILIIFLSFYFTKILLGNLKNLIPQMTQNISETVVKKTQTGITENFEKNVKSKFNNTVGDLERYLQ